MAEWVRRKKRIAESAVLIREYQKARAYAFPPCFAPDGKLREKTVNNYMQVMNLHYEYEKSHEDVTLKLVQTSADGSTHPYAIVGQLYSADFWWTKQEAIRLHVIAVLKNTMCVTEHYQVFDAGTAGIALTVPRRAWDNWRMWSDDAVEGIHQDKRILFMLLGDRAQIFNIDLDHFSKLNVVQVRSLLVHLTPGKWLIRPSIEEAGLDEGPGNSPTPPLVNISSSSSSGSDQSPQDKNKRQSEVDSSTTPPRSAIATRSRMFRGSTHKGEPPKNPFTLMFKSKVPRPGPILRHIHMGPRGALPRVIMDGMGSLSTESMARSSRSSSDANQPQPDEELTDEQVPSSSSNRDEEGEVTDESVQESFQEETSVEEISSSSDRSRNASGVFDMTSISGVTSFNTTCDQSCLSSTSDWDGPYPMDDSVEVFLAKHLSNSQVVDVSTDSSVRGASKGQASDTSLMDI